MEKRTKMCPTCGIAKVHPEFGRNRARKDGLSFYCTTCARAKDAEWRKRSPEQAERNKLRLRELYVDQDRYLDYLYRSKFGISLAEYEAELEAQGGGCAICGGQNPNGNRLAVDHDHECCSGKRSCGRCVRGLLCSNCNHGLGKFGDDVGRLSKAIEYLTI